MPACAPVHFGERMAILQGLDVVLVNTRFPENIGMAARACANMGCDHITLVTPERWIRQKAEPLATPKGQPLLDSISVCPSVEDAVAQAALVVGTTARRGGWRQAMLTPEDCAREVAACLAAGGRVSLVFGPEDRGLDNAAITHCHRLVTIPTAQEASSLNLAQAVLLLLYECASAVRRQEHAARPREDGSQGQLASAEDQERLMTSLRDMLLRIDYLHGDNPEYFLMPWRRLLGRARLRRHEYDALMGMCRQVRRALERAADADSSAARHDADEKKS